MNKKSAMRVFLAVAAFSAATFLLNSSVVDTGDLREGIIEQDGRIQYRSNRYEFTLVFPKEIRTFYIREYNPLSLLPYRPIAEINFDYEFRGNIPYEQSPERFGIIFTLLIYDRDKCDERGYEEEVYLWCNEIMFGQQKEGISHFGQESLKYAFVGYWVRHGEFLYVLNDNTGVMAPEEIRDKFKLQF